MSLKTFSRKVRGPYLLNTTSPSLGGGSHPLETFLNNSAVPQKLNQNFQF